MKTKLRSLFGVFALLVGIHSALAQPVLSISRSGTYSVIAWPTSVTNYVLQSSANLATPGWMTVSNIAQVIVSNNVNVTVTNTFQTQFFRLHDTNQTILPTGMVLIPAGEFTMGDTLDGESDATPAVEVYVSGFFMDVDLITYSKWLSVYYWATNHGYTFGDAGQGVAYNYPVQAVDWYDCAKWCNARSEQEGKPPVYYTDAGFTQVYTSGDVDTVYAVWTNLSYRLPTEAEWEKAARGGLAGQRFPWGDTISETNANYYSYGPTFSSYDLGPVGYNPAGLVGGYPGPTPGGTFAPNGYGLNDMAGNLIEWCWDLYATPYAGGTDPHGPSPGPQNTRVLRSGDFRGFVYFCRTADRLFYNTDDASPSIGFRCVLPQAP